MNSIARYIDQAPIVQKVDNAIHWIKQLVEGKTWGTFISYGLNSPGAKF